MTPTLSPTTPLTALDRCDRCGAQAYVRVVLAAGGTTTEAVDHILATKLLRKIRDRHDTRPEDLEALRLAVEEAWPRLGSQGEPVKSTSIVRAELRRLGADEAA